MHWKLGNWELHDLTVHKDVHRNTGGAIVRVIFGHSHIGETGQTLHGLPMKQHSRAQMNCGDPGWPEKTKRRNPRYTLEVRLYRNCRI